MRLDPSGAGYGSADKGGALVGDRLATMNKDWFSARLRTVCFIEGEGAVDTELCVHIFRAQDRETAFRRAIGISNGHNQRFNNDDGAAVEWRFAEILTLDFLGDADLDGREVHSLLTGEAEDLPFDTVFMPETIKPGETGVPVVDTHSG